MEKPDEYQRFVNDQIQSYKEAESNPCKAEDNTRHFRPSAGFVFGSKTTGGDGIKIRESLQHGKNIYVNVCSHEIIERPKDSTGKPMNDMSKRSNEVEIPLVVGALRNIKDNTELAVDVVMHPLVLTESKKDMQFRRQLSHLALESVCVETKVTASIHDIFHKIDESIDKGYVGGRGEDGCIPILFPLIIDADGRVQALPNTSDTEANNLFISPETLISAKAECNSVLDSEAINILPDQKLGKNITLGRDIKLSKSSALNTTTAVSAYNEKKVKEEFLVKKALIEEVIDVVALPSSVRESDFGGNSDNVFSAESKSQEFDFHVYTENKLSEHVIVLAQITSNSKFLAVSLSGLTAQQVGAIDLQASVDKLLLIFDNDISKYIKVSGKFQMKVSEIAAKLSKKKCTVVINCPLIV